MSIIIPIVAANVAGILVFGGILSRKPYDPADGRDAPAQSSGVAGAAVVPAAVVPAAVVPGAAVVPAAVVPGAVVPAAVVPAVQEGEPAWIADLLSFDSVTDAHEREFAYKLLITQFVYQYEGSLALLIDDAPHLMTALRDPLATFILDVLFALRDDAVASGTWQVLGEVGDACNGSYSTECMDLVRDLDGGILGVLNHTNKYVSMAKTYFALIPTLDTDWSYKNKVVMHPTTLTEVQWNLMIVRKATFESVNRFRSTKTHDMFYDKATDRMQNIHDLKLFDSA